MDTKTQMGRNSQNKHGVLFTGCYRVSFLQGVTGCSFYSKFKSTLHIFSVINCYFHFFVGILPSSTLLGQEVVEGRTSKNSLFMRSPLDSMQSYREKRRNDFLYLSMKLSIVSGDARQACSSHRQIVFWICF